MAIQSEKTDLAVAGVATVNPVLGSVLKGVLELADKFNISFENKIPLKGLDGQDWGGGTSESALKHFMNVFAIDKLNEIANLGAEKNIVKLEKIYNELNSGTFTGSAIYFVDQNGQGQLWLQNTNNGMVQFLFVHTWKVLTKKASEVLNAVRKLKETETFGQPISTSDKPDVAKQAGFSNLNMILLGLLGISLIYAIVKNKF